MGITYTNFIVKQTGLLPKEQEVEFMIDSGATYSLVAGKGRYVYVTATVQQRINKAD